MLCYYEFLVHFIIGVIIITIILAHSIRCYCYLVIIT